MAKEQKKTSLSWLNGYLYQTTKSKSFSYDCTNLHSGHCII